MGILHYRQKPVVIHYIKAWRYKVYFRDILNKNINRLSQNRNPFQYRLSGLSEIRGKSFFKSSLEDEANLGSCKRMSSNTQVSIARIISISSQFSY